MDKTGKIALITGAGTGIGKAVALSLAAKGIHIVVNYSRSIEDAEKTAAEVRNLGVSCLLQKANVADDSQVRIMIEEVVRHFGRLHYLVNNAGTTDYVDYANLEGLTEEFWDRSLSVNVKGTFFVSRAAVPHLKQTKGSIVNLASISGITGKGSSIAYATSKAAVIGLTKSLALTLAPDIRVNAVAPGIVMTRWVDGREAHVKRLSEGTPLGRACFAEDVAEVVVPLLVSESMITGQTIVVDGGATIM